MSLVSEGYCLKHLVLTVCFSQPCGTWHMLITNNNSARLFHHVQKAFVVLSERILGFVHIHIRPDWWLCVCFVCICAMIVEFNMGVRQS